MNVERALALVTWRLLLGNRRWIVAVLCNGLLILIAWIFYANSGGEGPGFELEFYGSLVATVVFSGLLPLAALVFGTAALGQEIEDGSLSYLIAKPTARVRIVITKIAVAGAATVMTIVPGVVLSGWIVMGSPVHPLVRGVIFGAIVASVLYSGLFLAVSLFTRRALILGLVYVLGWEGALSRLFAGTRSLSIREYGTALSEWAAGRSFPGPLSSPLELGTAVWMAALTLGVAVVVATRRLEGLELAEEI